MIDREKAIKGLECCIPMTLRNGLGDCGNCPYDREITIDSELTECCHDLMTDALALLKAQEPRVFNVGDFYGEEFGYLEYRPNIPGFSNFEPSPILISDIDEENVTVVFHSASVQKLPLDRINKSWRIWSDYPTHELLKAVKWE